eukprot:1138605-Pelagomonas_calceolata.AAC.4
MSESDSLLPNEAASAFVRVCVCDIERMLPHFLALDSLRGKKGPGGLQPPSPREPDGPPPQALVAEPGTSCVWMVSAVVLQQSPVIGVWGAPTWSGSQWEALSFMHAAETASINLSFFCVEAPARTLWASMESNNLKGSSMWVRGPRRTCGTATHQTSGVKNLLTKPTTELSFTICTVPKSDRHRPDHLNGLHRLNSIAHCLQ